MTGFENLATLITIVFGLMLTDLFGSLHRLVRHRRVVRWHWLPLTVAWYVLAIVLKNWWDLLFAANPEAWEGGWLFLYHGHLLLLLYLLASAALPDEVPADGLDLRRHYFDNRRHFWSLLAVVNLVLVGYALLKPIMFDTPIQWSAVVGNAVMMIVVASLAWAGWFWYHAVIVLLLMAFLILEMVSKF